MKIKNNTDLAALKIVRDSMTSAEWADWLDTRDVRDQTGDGLVGLSKDLRVPLSAGGWPDEVALMRAWLEVRRS